MKLLVEHVTLLLWQLNLHSSVYYEATCEDFIVTATLSSSNAVHSSAHLSFTPPKVMHGGKNMGTTAFDR